ncbi:MAG: DUF3365 domain-containing protein [bacterium]|nr:DUF3365 domain-containing protein [bacterium]
MEFLATNEARSNWNKDQSFRRWATRHGGLYVRPDERTPPSPYLAHLPDRDLVTVDGLRLTLMNPAYMMRQMTEEFEKEYGIKGSITGKVLLNPINQADPWELQALERFDVKEQEEIVELATIGGDRYLRLMRPMVMEEGCMKCHGHLGFEVGDIRGGVSVSIPLEPYYASVQNTVTAAKGSHLTAWVIGLISIAAFSAVNRRREDKLQEAEQTVIRSQKMDALGKLSGGIAHDFNNLLVVMSGYAGMLAEGADHASEVRQYAGEILSASERARKLTQKLLGFSRGRPTENAAVDINSLLREDEEMLSKSLMARIELRLELADGLWSAWLDRNNLEDAILNLALNSLHAMPGAGRLTISTSNVQLAALEARELGLKKGQYVQVSVTDTGCGMDEAVRHKMFDPFFTTKGEEGTGLGMNQVYGFAQRSRGAVTVFSAPGEGTRVSLFVPRHRSHLDIGQTVDESQEPSGRTDEVILVVEDEPAVRKVAARILSSKGYRVLEAGDGLEALEILTRESVDLVFSDVIMPNMDGHQLAAIVRERHPATPVQLTSGFDDRRGGSASAYPGSILSKPYTSSAMLKLIRQRLDEAPREKREDRPTTTTG